MSSSNPTSHNALELVEEINDPCFAPPGNKSKSQDPAISRLMHAVNSKFIQLSGGNVTHILAMGNEVRRGLDLQMVPCEGDGSGFPSATTTIAGYDDALIKVMRHPGFLFREYHQVSYMVMGVLIVADSRQNFWKIKRQVYWGFLENLKESMESEGSDHGD